MKRLTFTNITGAVALLSGLAACATTNTAAVGPAQKEAMLSQAGFISKAVTTPKQQQQVEKLPAGLVSAVKCKGKLSYIYVMARKDRILVGKQAQYDAYKRALGAQPSRTPADKGAYLTGETAGPNRVIVQEFDGFGPLPDNPAWQ
jgi:hypothetical protein